MNTCYVVRASGPNGASSYGFNWPANGSVAAASIDKPLHGILDGDGCWLHALIMDYGHTFQVIECDREAVTAATLNHTFLSGTVKYNGTLPEVLESLRTEKSDYATLVASAVELGVREAMPQRDALTVALLKSTNMHDPERCLKELVDPFNPGYCTRSVGRIEGAQKDGDSNCERL